MVESFGTPGNYNLSFQDNTGGCKEDCNDGVDNDLDGDSDIDLASANFNSDNVSVFLNNGDGSFAPPVIYPAGTGTVSVFTADFGDRLWYSGFSNLTLGNERRQAG